jgi:hypothetical protein
MGVVCRMSMGFKNPVVVEAGLSRRRGSPNDPRPDRDVVASQHE